ncbi:MAG: 16S rRNA (guanine(527)-N(7))-methyltransferase RsmG [Crocinitomicaceae bacterium]|nr:16S rRNA (guanine(527)-N(7))-methyltransferase RsmG [Crocinitomicaceae bacterium]
MEVIDKYFPSLSEEQKSQFLKLGVSFTKWNSQINLVSRKDIDQFFTRHVLHSLAISKAMNFADGTKVLDVGTGGGLPGLPLAILYPEVEFVLCDSIGKKIKVVKALIEDIGLKNVKAHHLRANEVLGKFDFIVSRAVTRMSKFLPWVENKVSNRSINPFPNGILYLKGGDLQSELREINRASEVLPISDWFNEEFFETKAVVYVRLQ